MNSITDNMISLEEARYALQCMKNLSFSVEESLETIDGYIDRVRDVNMAWLTNYVIDTRLSEMQRSVIRRCCFDEISVADCAEELGVSLRAVYSAKAKAMDIIGGYLEPLVMYFRNLSDKEKVPLFVNRSMEILSAQKAAEGKVGNIMKNIRVSQGADISIASKMTGVSEKEIHALEKGMKQPTIEELKKYSQAFGVKITLEIDKGNGELKWKKQ